MLNGSERLLYYLLSMHLDWELLGGFRDQDLRRVVSRNIIKRIFIIKGWLREIWEPVLWNLAIKIEKYLISSSLWKGCCSVTKSCTTLHDPMDCSTPGSSVLNYLPAFAQIHVHWASDAIHPFHPLSSSSSPAFNLSQHQGLFKKW